MWRHIEVTSNTHRIPVDAYCYGPSDYNHDKLQKVLSIILLLFLMTLKSTDKTL